MTNTNIIKRLQGYTTSTNHSYKVLADYLLEYEGKYSELKIIPVCEKLFISTAVPTRLAQSLGLSGFNELKIDLANEQADSKQAVTTYQNKSLDSYVSDITNSLENSFKLLNLATIDAVANKLLEANKLSIFAVGGSYLASQDFHYKLLRLNINSSLEPDRHVQYFMAKNLEPNDFALGVSYSGTTKEVLKGLDIAKRNGAYTVLITSNLRINANSYDEVIYIQPNEILTRGFSIVSRTTIISILDIIYISIINTAEGKYHEKLRQNRFKDY